MHFVYSRILTIGLFVLAIFSVAVQTSYAQKNGGSRSKVLTGQGAAGDWSTDLPGVRRHVTVTDLPKPYQSDSARNGPKLVPRPQGALPIVPAGFRVEEFASGFKNPRLLRVAPNGDVFVAESRANLVRVIRATKDGSRAEVNEIFVDNLKRPFGIAFYPAGQDPQWIYIGNTDSVVRFPYRNGDLKPRGNVEVIVPDIPGWGELRGGGHWTRDIVFSPNGRKMFVSVGSRSNVFEDPKENEVDRATVLENEPLCIRFGGQMQVGPFQYRIEERLGSADPKPPLNHGHRGADAFVVGFVVVLDGTQARVHASIDDVLAQRIWKLRLRNVQGPADTARRRGAELVVLEGLVDRQDVIPAPAAVAEPLEFVVVLAVSAVVHQTVD